MNLLLLLSALLSALSGVGQAVRGARAPQTVCASVASRPAAAACERSAAVRPVTPLSDAARYRVWPVAAFRLLPAEPIFAGRRRQ